MAGLDADTSSYNQPLPVGPMEQASKIGALQQQSQQIQSGALTIDKQKLDLMNQQFSLINQELSGMVDDPNITKEQAAARLNKFADTYKLPDVARQHMNAELQAAPSVKAFSENALRRGMDTQQRINQQYGTIETTGDQANTFQGVRAPAAKGGGFIPSTRMPVQQPPGTTYFNEENQQKLLPPVGPSGVVSVPQARPALPIGGPAAATPSPMDNSPATFAQRTDAAFPKGGLNAGPSPLFNEGKEAYTKAQLNAGVRAQAIKPAIQALKLMPGLATGPGTGQYTDLVAAAKAWGIVDTKAENDPTVLRQEIEKKLAQYVGGSPIGQRSDAQQALAEAGSPNPKKQILPALQDLTRDAIALERVQILLPQAFKGQDFQNFIKHTGNFPQSVDEKALSLDMLPDESRVKLVNKMVSKYKNGNADEKKKANKFLDTLKLARDAGLYEGAQ